MNFSTDRDLLVIEPDVFDDVPIAAQQRLRAGEGVVTGTTLTIPEGDFAASRVEAGSVVLIDGVAHEVIERIDEGTLTVSLPRTRLSDAPLPGEEGTQREVIARTFAPQARLIHDGLLRQLGIRADDPTEVLDEEAVISLSAMARLEALGTLERVYSGAIALAGDNTNVQVKATDYRRRFREAMAGTSVAIDTDGDGLANEWRSPGLVRMRRG